MVWEGSRHSPKFFYELPEGDDNPPEFEHQVEDTNHFTKPRPRKRMYTRSNPPPDLHLFEDSEIDEFDDLEYRIP